MPNIFDGNKQIIFCYRCVILFQQRFRVLFWCPTFRITAFHMSEHIDLFWLIAVSISDWGTGKKKLCQLRQWIFSPSITDLYEVIHVSDSFDVYGEPIEETSINIFLNYCRFSRKWHKFLFHYNVTLIEFL